MSPPATQPVLPSRERAEVWAEHRRDAVLELHAVTELPSPLVTRESGRDWECHCQILPPQGLGKGCDSNLGHLGTRAIRVQIN